MVQTKVLNELQLGLFPWKNWLHRSKQHGFSHRCRSRAGRSVLVLMFCCVAIVVYIPGYMSLAFQQNSSINPNKIALKQRLQRNRVVSRGAKVDREEITDKAYHKAEKANLQTRAPLSSLWEQWGLLGLLVGTVVAIGASGVFDSDVTALVEQVPDLLATIFQQDTQDIQDGLETGIGTALASSLSVASLGELQTSADAAEVIAGMREVEEVEGATSASAIVAETSEAVATSLPVISESISAVANTAVLAGSFGFAGAFAGLVKEGIEDKAAQGTDSGFIVPSATFTPGTIRSSEDVEDRPMSAWELATSNFASEWRKLVQAARFGAGATRRPVPQLVYDLILKNQAVSDRENAREAVPTPAPVRLAYDVLCWFIDVVFEDRPIQRFWFLETVARMPYFAYTSVLHLYETLGWWRSPELRAVHAAQEDNELHHLLIMESLGGDQRWLDRFFAQHGAIAYYWILVLFFVVDPKWSYNFSRLIEAHAVDTYGEFVDANEERLRMSAPPPIAVEYYKSNEFYLFDKFQTVLAKTGSLRRPPCSTLYDVFSNIRDDEAQHVLTMGACEDWVSGGPPPIQTGFNCLSDEEYERKVTETAEGRKAWAARGKQVTEAARITGRQKVKA